MRKLIIVICSIILLVFIGFYSLLMREHSAQKAYYLSKPTEAVEPITRNDGVGVYIVNKSPGKQWVGHLVVPKFNSFINYSDIVYWSELLPKGKVLGSVYVDSINSEVIVSIYVSDSQNKSYLPYHGNGVFHLYN